MRVAEGNPATFYRGTDFRGVDVSGQDLRDIDFTAASFVGVIADGNTKIDAKYEVALLQGARLASTFRVVRTNEPEAAMALLTALVGAIEARDRDSMSQTVEAMVGSLLPPNLAPLAATMFDGFEDVLAGLLERWALRYGESLQAADTLVAFARLERKELFSPQIYLVWLIQWMVSGNWPIAQGARMFSAAEGLGINIRQILSDELQSQRARTGIALLRSDLVPDFVDGLAVRLLRDAGPGNVASMPLMAELLISAERDELVERTLVAYLLRLTDIERTQVAMFAASSIRNDAQPWSLLGRLGQFSDWGLKEVWPVSGVAPADIETLVRFQESLLRVATPISRREYDGLQGLLADLARLLDGAMEAVPEHARLVALLEGLRAFPRPHFSD